MTKKPRTKPTRTAYETPTPQKRAIGRRLREAREINGMTLTEAAERLGYSQPKDLSYWETGQRMPPFDRLLQLSKLYGTSMDFLCGLQDDPDRDPAVAASRAVAGLVSASVDRIVRTLTDRNVEIVRGMLPGSGEAQRMASLAIEARQALVRMRELNPGFDERLRGGAQLVAKFDALHALALEYTAAVAKANRVMQARTSRDAANFAQCPAGPTNQIPLLPVIDQLALAEAQAAHEQRQAELQAEREPG